MGACPGGTFPSRFRQLVSRERGREGGQKMMCEVCLWGFSSVVFYTKRRHKERIHDVCVLDADNNHSMLGTPMSSVSHAPQRIL